MLAAGVGIGSGGIEPAWGGAWLLAPGDGQAIVYSAFSDSARAFDAYGNLIPVRQYKKFELGTYIEYGLTDWLTLVVAPAYDRIRNPPPGQSYNGIGESAAAAKVRIFQNENSIISFQAGVRSPGASLADSLGPFQVRRAASLELRGLAGRSIDILGMDSFVDAEAAYRFYAGNQPGEFLLDLTIGTRPFPNLLLMLQSFTSITNGSSKFGHVSWTKLQPSFVYNLNPQWSIQIGGFLTVAGVNAGRELGPMLGIWYKF
jgi:protein XagA